MLTFAAIDIGSYDVSLELFEVSKKNGIHSIDRVKKRIELGADIFHTKTISPQKAEQLCNVLAEFKKIADGYHADACRVIATRGLREAKNQIFICGKIRQMTGLEVQILSNSEQRFLRYKAIASIEKRFRSIIKKGTVIVDVGGDSVQLSLFDKEALITTQNIRMGSLRLRERLQPLAAETEDYEQLVKEMIWFNLESFRKMYLQDRKIENLIISGDFLTDVLFRDIHDKAERVLDRETFDKWYCRIIGQSPYDLALSNSISLSFASLMRPAVVIYHCLVEEMDADFIWTPGTHLSRGLAYEFAERKHMLKSSHDFKNDIISAGRQIAKRYCVSEAHIENMDMMAAVLWNATRSIHGMSERDRLVMRIAVMLHDVGKFISYNFTGDSSYHILMSNEIIGLSHAEREMIALCAKYNSQEFPSYEQLVLMSSLDRKQYLKLAYFLAIIRYVNALDRSHRQKVKKISAQRKENRLLIRLEVRQSFVLEKGLIGNKAAFFQEVFGLEPVLKIKNSGEVPA